MFSAEYVGIAVAWLCAVLSKIESLKGPELSKRIVATVIIVISTIGSGVAVYTIYTNSQLKPVDVPEDETIALKLQEASGGSAAGDRAYAVDDETSSVIALVTSADSQYEFKNVMPIVENGKELSKDDVNDLEGLAIDPSDQSILYLTTSHSDNKNAKFNEARNRLIRACVSEGDRAVVVLDRISLRTALEQILFGGDNPIAVRYSYPDRDSPNNARTETVMEIEGLAADPNGYLYFGLRAPLAKNDFAIVVRAQTRNLFPDKPKCDEPPFVELREASSDKFEVEEIILKAAGKYYGIVSLEYDSISGDIVILGNSRDPYTVQPPILCRWDVGKQPRCRFTPGTQEPYWGKPEALLLGPGQDYVTVLIDTDKGVGGRIRYLRSEVGL